MDVQSKIDAKLFNADKNLHLIARVITIIIIVMVNKNIYQKSLTTIQTVKIKLQMDFLHCRTTHPIDLKNLFFTVS